jgi:hypothetical protein
MARRADRHDTTTRPVPRPGATWPASACQPDHERGELRPDRFPDRAASLLSGLLAATRKELGERVAPAVAAHDLGRRKGSHDLWRPHVEHDRDRRRVDRTVRPHDRLGGRAERSGRPTRWRLRRRRRRCRRRHCGERAQTRPTTFAADSCEHVAHRRQGDSARLRTRRSHCPAHRSLYAASNPTPPRSERWYLAPCHVGNFPRAPTDSSGAGLDRRNRRLIRRGVRPESAQLHSLDAGGCASRVSWGFDLRLAGLRPRLGRLRRSHGLPISRPAAAPSRGSAGRRSPSCRRAPRPARPTP